ncbi:MAG: beta-galactosidase [Tepidisphaeraceae bacterium]
MKAAHCNIVSIGIFSWVMLEPEEGRFEFGWMDEIVDKLTKNGVYFNMATPGGAKPAWMAQKYPDTLRTDKFRRKQLWGDRHNHCFTSPNFRERARIINTKLAERYGKHPNLAMWHVNNEYSEDCHCDLCQAAFREFLKKRYDNDLKKLNAAWWSTFWSHTITDWEQIQSPTPIGEWSVHGLTLDWKRFATDQTIDCFNAESAPLRELSKAPITANQMDYFGLDYHKLGRACDVVSWDSYPSFHDRPEDTATGVRFSFNHDLRRSMLRKPFILMESAPAQQNYKPVCKLKRPGMHQLEGLQAVAHGSDSVMYFQWRKSRGSVEKFHGAVVDHHGADQTRVFKDVAGIGEILTKLDGVVGSVTDAKVGLIFDYENNWAIADAAGPRNPDKQYRDTVVEHYRAFWQQGVSVDVIDSVADFSPYKLLVAPMLYMLRPGVAERIIKFVEAGGTFVTTYFSGVVDESDLCFLNGWPGPLRKLMGVWAEELDSLYDDESATIKVTENALGLRGEYKAKQFCDLIHAEGATVLATYASEFYAGRPALTVNQAGQGEAYYVASRNDEKFNDDFFSSLVKKLNLPRAMNTTLPAGVTAQLRKGADKDFVFVFSFARTANTVTLDGHAYTDAVTGEPVGPTLDVPAYASRVLVRKSV